jgi:hypothetical protein
MSGGVERAELVEPGRVRGRCHSVEDRLGSDWVDTCTVLGRARDPQDCHEDGHGQNALQCQPPGSACRNEGPYVRGSAAARIKGSHFQFIGDKEGEQ